MATMLESVRLHFLFKIKISEYQIFNFDMASYVTKVSIKRLKSLKGYQRWIMLHHWCYILLLHLSLNKTSASIDRRDLWEPVEHLIVTFEASLEKFRNQIRTGSSDHHMGNKIKCSEPRIIIWQRSDFVD